MKAIRQQTTIGLALLLSFAGSLTLGTLSTYGAISAQTARQAVEPTLTPAAEQTDRPTSRPYAGDLSIF